MSPKPKVLLVRGSNGEAAKLPDGFFEVFEIVKADSPLAAMEYLAKEQDLAGMFIASGRRDEAMRLERLLENERILKRMPDGVALLNSENVVLWANDTFCSWSACNDCY